MKLRKTSYCAKGKILNINRFSFSDITFCFLTPLLWEEPDVEEDYCLRKKTETMDKGVDNQLLSFKSFVNLIMGFRLYLRIRTNLFCSPFFPSPAFPSRLKTLQWSWKRIQKRHTFCAPKKRELLHSRIWEHTGRLWKLVCLLFQGDKTQLPRLREQEEEELH
jgi:hypothetical protein